MKRHSLLAGLFLLLLPVLAFAQTVTPNLGLTKPTAVPGSWGEDINNNFDILDADSIDTIPRVTNATKPASPVANQVIVVTDALNGTTCTAGGGSSNNTCQWNGSAWVVIGGGGGGGGGGGFDAITSGTNAGATMVVGTGASLSASGSGTITATSSATATQLAANGANCSGSLPRGVDASGAAEGCAAVDLTTEVTGILPLANGGLASGTAAGGRSTLSVPSFAEVQSGALDFCSDAGANDTYTCSVTPALTAYTNGQYILFRPNTSNTGAATININSLGAKDIRRSDGSTVLSDNDLLAGRRYWLTYDGTLFRMQQGDQGGGSFLPLSGGTLTGQLVTDNLGIEFEESDTNPTCGAGNYNIYADLSETKFKKCTNGVASDLAPAEADTLATVKARGRDIADAVSSATAVRIGSSSTGRYTILYDDATTGPVVNCEVSGVVGDCNKNIGLNSGKTFSILNSSSSAIFTVTESTAAVTNMTMNAEGSGNTITMPFTQYWEVAACQAGVAQLIWDSPSSNAPQAVCDAADTVMATADFDATTDESIEKSFKLPLDWTGAIDVNFIWKAAATTGAVGWCLQIARTPDGAVSSTSFAAQAAGNCVSDTAKGTTLQENVASKAGVTCTSCAAGDRLKLRVSRDANGGAVTDDMTGDAKLIGIELIYRRAM